MKWREVFAWPGPNSAEHVAVVHMTAMISRRSAAERAARLLTDIGDYSTLHGWGPICRDLTGSTMSYGQLDLLGEQLEKVLEIIATGDIRQGPH
jgi:hypothetical protein